MSDLLDQGRLAYEAYQTSRRYHDGPLAEPRDWAELRVGEKQHWQAVAQAVGEAAAPLIAAQVLRGAADDVVDLCPVVLTEDHPADGCDFHRISKWLRRRAENGRERSHAEPDKRGENR